MKCRVEALLVKLPRRRGVEILGGEGAVRSSYDVFCLHFSQPRAATLVSLTPCLARVMEAEWRKRAPL